MTTKDKPNEQERSDEPRLQEQFVPQAEDRSLAAREILTDQQDDGRPVEAASRLFVP